VAKDKEPEKGGKDGKDGKDGSTDTPLKKPSRRAPDRASGGKKAS
jgi:hypothetical protein